MQIDTGNSILETVDLSIGYRKSKTVIPVADQINIQLFSGRLVALIGPNGAGKSTLLRTLSGVQPALSGDVFLLGKALKTFSRSQRAVRCSVVLTVPLATKNLTVMEVVALGRYPHTNWIGMLKAEDRIQVQRAIELTDLQAFERRKCHDLSDGQFQRVLIARALAQDTPLVLLDEPTTHLDLYHKAHVLRMLKRLTRTTQKTLFYATHDLDLALSLCDEIVLMTDDGIQQGTPDALITQGVFEELFPRDVLIFDSKQRKFIVRTQFRTQ